MAVSPRAKFFSYFRRVQRIFFVFFDGPHRVCLNFLPVLFQRRLFFSRVEVPNPKEKPTSVTKDAIIFQKFVHIVLKHTTMVDFFHFGRFFFAFPLFFALFPSTFLFFGSILRLLSLLFLHFFPILVSHRGLSPSPSFILTALFDCSFNIFRPAFV